MKFISVSLLLSTCVALCLSSAIPESLSLAKSSSNIHAVLVAGSNGFENYRHQADVCHAYQVLRSHGVPSENIIVMMYDDIANNKENPYPGRIFNVPNGTDVYQGVSKDYTGPEVNSENFMKVLKGDKELAAKGKKVLQTGPDDHVFIYFADHGGTGIICFPSDSLTSQDLNETLTYMHQNKMYGKLTFYLESCESGSMFNNILSDELNVYATTAANPFESSYGCFCDQPDIYTCLGDEYSVAWILDSEGNVISKEPLETQFQHVTKTVKNSSPQEYGDKTLANLDVGEFQGESQSSIDAFVKHVKVTGQYNSRDIPLFNLKRKLASNLSSNETSEAQSKLLNVISGRRFYDRAIRNVIDELCTKGFCSHAADVLSIRSPLIDHNSYSKIVKQFNASCLNVAIHYYGLKYMYAFANIVESNNFDPASLEKFQHYLEKACLNHVVAHGYDAII
uniref:legumain n=1 Tax=Tetranychus urticae TaxID=32264 RepID=T1KP86_TETUR